MQFIGGFVINLGTNFIAPESRIATRDKHRSGKTNATQCHLRYDNKNAYDSRDCDFGGGNTATKIEEHQRRSRELIRVIKINCCLLFW